MKSVNLLGALHQSLAKDQKKIEIISDNIARAPLPHEKTKILKESGFHQTLSKVFGSGINRTHANHLMGREGQKDSFKTTYEKSAAGQVSLTGNTIQPQEELRKLNETYTKSYEIQTQFASLNGRIRKVLSSLK